MADPLPSDSASILRDPADRQIDLQTVRSPKRHRSRRTRFAVGVGRLAARLSRHWGIGSGGIVGGRVALALEPSILTTLSREKSVVLVTGTNGKTTTSHLLAAAVRTTASVAHNATGANMTDGAVAALMADPDAAVAVLEVDELHLPVIAEATAPTVICLLNLTRDQLDRGNEVRMTAAIIRRTLIRSPAVTIIAVADDPMAVWAADTASRVIWVGTGITWAHDATSCPRCSGSIRWSERADGVDWACDCGLRRPTPHWHLSAGTVTSPNTACALELALPGRVNRANAVVAMTAAAELGVSPTLSAAAMCTLAEVDGRYARVRYGKHDLRLLLAKNPAGWAETLDLLRDSPAALIVVNSAEADGRDVSWIWDVDFTPLRGRPVACGGARWADLGVRMSYAEVDHRATRDPLAALATLPPGPVDVATNYTAFHQIRRRIAHTGGPSGSNP